MNKLSILIVLGLLFAVLSTTAYAAITVASPTIGGAEQKRGVNATTTFVITNEDTANSVTVTGIAFNAVTVSTADSRAYSSDFASAVLFDNTSFTLAANGAASGSNSKTITISNAFVPRNFDAVNGDFVQTAFKIGTITVSGTSNSAAVSGSANVNMRAENALDIKNVDITIDDVTDSLDDGDNLKNIKPGDKLDIEITVENLFDENDYDVTIKDVVVAAKVDDSNFDLDEDDDAADLDAEEQDTVAFAGVEVDSDADGSYDLEVSVDGKDENGAKHATKWTIGLEVERETHELSITSAKLVKTAVTCRDGFIENVALKTTIANLGKRDETKGAIEVVSSGLKLDLTKGNLALDQDDSTGYTFSIPVPAETKTGAYEIEVIAYYADDIETDRTSVTLAVQGCAAAPVTTPVVTPINTTPAATTPTVTTPAATTPITSTTSAPVAKVTAAKSTFSDSQTYIYLLSAAVIVLLIATIWIGFKLAVISKA